VNADKLNRFWLVATLVLIIIILAASLTSGYGATKVRLWQSSSSSGGRDSREVYLEGAVANPGIYSFSPAKVSRALSRVLAALTKMPTSAGSGLHSTIGENPTAQKIDINLAEEWLLQALPASARSGSGHYRLS